MASRYGRAVLFFSCVGVRLTAGDDAAARRHHTRKPPASFLIQVLLGDSESRTTSATALVYGDVGYNGGAAVTKNTVGLDFAHRVLALWWSGFDAERPRRRT